MGEAEQGQAAPTEQQAQQQSPETPAPQTQETSTPASTDASQEAGKGEAAQEADWQKQLDELIEKAGKDLWKHPKIAGRVGQLSERQAKQLADAQIAVDRNRVEQERLEALRKTNEVAWAREKSRIEDAKSNEQAEWGEFVATMSGRYNALPEESKQALAGKDYGRNIAGAKLAYLNDLVEHETDHRANSKLKSLLEKERETAREAGRKEALAAKAGGEHTPDLSAGGTAPAGDLDQGEWDRNRGNRTWREANRDRIERAVSKGAIRH